MIPIEKIKTALADFSNNTPFDHCVIDDFFDQEIAESLSKEFLEYESSEWIFYDNPIENKKTLNVWDAFPALTYRILDFLQGPEIVALLEEAAGRKVYVDHGLHGGGWHIHGQGGNLNPHLDYSIHPKTGLQRLLNLIIYLSPEMQPEYGGHLGFWTHDAANNRPAALVKEIAPRFNRAVLFNTTQNSWHGISRPLTQPAGVFRKSLAIYYLCEPPLNACERGRALFAPRESQRGDTEIENLIRLRSRVDTSSAVYRLDRQQDVSANGYPIVK